MAIAESILFQINSSNYTAPIFTMYQPQAGYSGFVTTLRLTVNINSIEEANFPYIPDDTPPDVLQAILDEVAINTPFKEIILYVKKGNGAWIERAPIRIFNKEPYYDINLMRFFSDSNTIDVAEDLSLGIQIKTGNVLTSADAVLVWGSVVAEKKNNGNEELADRISALETLLSVFGAPSASLPGTNGLVPMPPAGGSEFLLRGDRVWENPSKFATPAQITAAINTLVGDSTTALNTLAELGAALANDANFAATITNALVTKLNKNLNLSDLDSRQTALNTLAGGVSAGRLLGGNGTNIVLRCVDLATEDVTGVLPIANGGNYSSINHTFKAGKTAHQAFTNSAWTKITFGTEITDTNNQYSPTNSRLTAIATETWTISPNVTVNLPATSRLLLSVWKNGAEVAGSRYLDIVANAGDFQLASNLEFALAAGDYLEVYVLVIAGAPYIFGEGQMLATSWSGKRIK